MTNRYNSVLYTGVTNDLKRRITEHKNGCGSNFTSRYNCVKLVYYEVYEDIKIAIEREKAIKHYKRQWKNTLVESVNPQWEDLSDNLIQSPDI